MQINEIKKQLANGEVGSIYYFVGEESAVIDVYIDKIIELAGVPVIRTDELKKVFSTIQNRSLISGRNLYIIRDDKDYLSQEKLWAPINSGITQKGNILIFVYTNVSITPKFEKANESMITMFPKMTANVIAKNISKTYDCSQDTGEWIAEICANDYRRCLIEMNKVQNYSTAHNISIDEAMQRCVEEKIIYVYEQEEIQSFIAALCTRNAFDSFDIHRVLKQNGTSPLAVLALLYPTVRAMLMIGDIGANAKDLASRTGLNGYMIQVAKGYDGYYEKGELVKILRTVREMERGLKTGLINPDMAIDYLMVNML